MASQSSLLGTSGAPLLKTRCDFLNFREIVLRFCWQFLAAIGACKQRISASGVAECNDNGNVLSECSEQTSTEGTPIFEEFIPMKRASRSEDDKGDEEEQHSHKQMNMDKEINASEEMISGADIKKKSDWLKSAQLWNQTPDLPSKEVINCSILARNVP